MILPEDCADPCRNVDCFVGPAGMVSEGSMLARGRSTKAQEEDVQLSMQEEQEEDHELEDALEGLDTAQVVGKMVEWSLSGV